jgi:CHASE2 domain-containing sensor protein
MKKPLHQHITHRIRKYHRHITKYLYERDTIFATAWVFLFILMVKIIPLPNIHFFDPIELALEDFDFNDIAYSKLKKSDTTHIDKSIVIINIGEADREGLAMIIEKTAALQPRVMGLDVLLDGPRDPYKDSLLRLAIEKNKNLVIASRLDWKNDKQPYQRSYFAPVSHLEGYVNMLSEELATVRLWVPFFEKEDPHAKPYQSFAATLIEGYDSSLFQRLEKRHNKYETINYTRRVTDRIKQYQVVEGEDLLTGNVDSAAIKGKIALLGYINLDPESIEDKKFTPMNEKFAGKSIPDMNGVVVHANMISMALENNYIKKLPSWVNFLVAILVGWLHMSFFIRYYLENHIWFHLVAKFAQLLSAIFFVYLGILLFDKFAIRLDMSLTLVVIVLAVDIIYFYEAFAVWMNKKFGYKTVFHQQHH